MGRCCFCISHHERQDDHREPQLHGSLEVEVLQRREHDARQENTRRSLETPCVLALGAARARRVLVLAEGDTDGLCQPVADASHEDEDEDEVGLRRSSEEPAEEEQHEQAREDVARHDPLERVRAVLWPVERVELQHEERRALADGLDEQQEAQERSEVPPGERERAVAHGARVLVGLDQQRHQVGRQQLELPRVVDLEHRVALGDDVAGVVHEAEEAADDAAERGHAHHDEHLGQQEEPEAGVAPELGL
ncbi:unnamed protein product [Phytophthora fragariaefolia]|uniref:Unnamed protein product n=1 Tax=Phytophthora fragariaefolia TaxID=1490495 RepID=A0A9W7DAG2_9STRA|nr:unnamed protein product [Phytophthora fragariaefolia]